MTPWIVMWSAFMLGLITSVSPCPLATNIAAVSFLSRSAGNSRLTLLSGLLYTLGRMAVYTVLGILILLLFYNAGNDGTASIISVFLQRYMGIVIGPALILVGMILTGLLELSGSLTFGDGQELQKRIARGGAFWSLPLGVFFALSFCPVSASLFFMGLIGLSTQHSSPVLLPALFGIGTAVPVLFFTLLIVISVNTVGKAFNHLTKIEKLIRLGAGIVFILAGVFYTLTQTYGLG